MVQIVNNPRKIAILVVYCMFCFACISIEPVMADQDGNQQVSFDGFYSSLQDGVDAESLKVGQEMFGHLEKKYRLDSGFAALKSKLAAAEFLSKKMAIQLRKASGRQMFAMADELFENKRKKSGGNALAIAPAQSFYETSKQIFSKPVKISNLNNDEKSFLANFYDLKLRVLTSKVAKAGQALAIAEPGFDGTHNYVLVLPLLHAFEPQSINIDVLPKWMRQAKQLSLFSDSCLMHYGFPFHAEAFARESAKSNKQKFSSEKFYRTAAKKCEKQLPNVAVDCLKRALDTVEENKVDERVEIHFEIVQVWLDSKKFLLASGEAKDITEKYKDHKFAGKAFWLYYYSLSRANNAKPILATVDSVIEDPRCSAYKAKLMYVKWWALRRQRDQIVQIAALEHKLLDEFGYDPMVAPILLSRATDLLAQQNHLRAIEFLRQLKDKFPDTKAAAQAEKMLKKLEK